MIIERIDERPFCYQCRYSDSGVPIAKFTSLPLATLFVRYIGKCHLSEGDEHKVVEALWFYDKMMRKNA